MTRILSFVLIAFLFLSCKKSCDECQSFNESLFVTFKLDGVAYSSKLPENVLNSREGQNPQPYYFSSGARFLFLKNSYFTCELGFVRGDAEWAKTMQGLRILGEPGSKEYDFLQGEFHDVYNKVELDFRDENGIYWTSTKQKYNPDTFEFTSRVVDQPGSNFQITESREYQIRGSEPNPAMIAKAKFNCILYEGNGERTKILTDGEINFIFY